MKFNDLKVKFVEDIKIEIKNEINSFILKQEEKIEKIESAVATVQAEACNKPTTQNWRILNNMIGALCKDRWSSRSGK